MDYYSLGTRLSGSEQDSRVTTGARAWNQMSLRTEEAFFILIDVLTFS